jgi:hypothetical protein
MRYFKFTVTCALGLACSSLALSQEPAAPALNKHELNICMSRQMSSNRTLSYNDAAKTCKDQLQGQKLQAAAREVPKAVAGT